MRRILVALLVVLLCSTSCALMARVSYGDAGWGNFTSGEPSVSLDGRYIAFGSDADQLVAGDTNGISDVFVKDLVTGTVEMISWDRFGKGSPSNGVSQQPEITADGRYVVFWSYASDLVAGDVNGQGDVFVHDRNTGVTQIVSISSSGVQGNSLSFGGSISDDGRFVAYQSFSDNLTVGDINNDYDIFVRDRTAGTTLLLSVATGGRPGNGGSFDPVVSGDGTTVAFWSFATDLVAGDTNGVSDVFASPSTTPAVSLVSVDRFGGPANGFSQLPSISDNGRFVAFESGASDLVAGDTNVRVDIFRRDRTGAATVLVSEDTAGGPANNSSGFASISGNGSRVAFHSTATDLVPGDTNGERDVFVWGGPDTERSSVDLNGVQGNDASNGPAMSGDGRVVAFGTEATNLGAGDTNGVGDIVARAALIPRIDSIEVDVLQPGWTQTFIVFGRNFNATTYASLFGDGVGSVTTTLLSTFALEVEVSLDAGASPGDRDLWVIDPHPALGFLTVGAGDRDPVPIAAYEGVSFSDAVAPGGGSETGGNFDLSSSGRYAVFESDSDQLVPGDTNGRRDVFRHDMVTGTFERVSTLSDGSQMVKGGTDPRVSGDGRYVTFRTTEALADALNSNNKVVVKDMVTGTLTTVTPGGCFQDVGVPEISRDGNWVVFQRDNCGSAVGPVQRWNRSTQVTDEVYSGGDLASVSADGRFVAFRGYLGNHIAVRDMNIASGNPGAYEQIDVPADGVSSTNGIDLRPSISDDGNRVVFASRDTTLVTNPDGNGDPDVFLRDRAAGTTTLLSQTPAGAAGNDGAGSTTAISGDGSSVVFTSAATDLVPDVDVSSGSEAFRWSDGDLVPLTPSTEEAVVGAAADVDGDCVLFASYDSFGLPNAGGRDVFRWDGGGCA